MYEEFKKLNYWKSPKKIRLERELINRLYADYFIKLARIKALEDTLTHLSHSIPSGPITSNLPDLTIIDVVANVQESYVSFAITVQNIGTKLAETCMLSITVDTAVVNILVPSLDIGQSTILSCILPFDGTGSIITHTDISFVDCFNQIIEIRKDNNIFTGSFSTNGVIPNAGTSIEFIYVVPHPDPYISSYHRTYIDNVLYHASFSYGTFIGMDLVLPGYETWDRTAPITVISGLHHIKHTEDGVFNSEFDITVIEGVTTICNVIVL